MARIKRISVDRLTVGMYLAEEGNDWIPAANTKRSGEIKTEAVLQQITTFGVSTVLIDIEQGIDCPTGESLQTRSVSAPKPLAEEKARAEQVHGQALDLVQETMANVKCGKSIDVSQVDALADDMVDSIYANQNALVCLSQIRSKDTYLLEHSCNVGLLLGVLAKGMGFAPCEVQELITGGMLHDIGKIRVDDAILHKEGKLDDKEWVEMRNHVNYGVEALEATGGISEVIMSICSQHHERLDGGGYPFGLSKGEISLYGRMATVVDVYDAITADRCYHKGMAAAVAMKRLNEWSGDHMDQEIVHHFVRAMSVYPVGSMVQLDSAELALVIETNPAKPAQPVVKIIFSVNAYSYLPVKVVDLASPSEKRKILKPVEAKTYDIAIGDFI